jgi:hypothetical protein
MKKIMVLLTSIVLAGFISLQAYAKDVYLSSSDKDYKAAEKIINQYFQAYVNKDSAELKKIILPDFQKIDHGQVFNYQASLESIKTIDIKNFKIANFSVLKSKDVLVVIYTIEGPETMQGEQVLPAPFYRMTILQNFNGNWYILAHANMAQVKN